VAGNKGAISADRALAWVQLAMRIFSCTALPANLCAPKVAPSSAGMDKLAIWAEMKRVY
jgi:hypothetical protein